MMKVQMTESDGQLTIQVEGRLAAAFVPELENCWQRARREWPKRNISVDLKSVTCVDRSGRQLLHAMHHNGVHFLRAGLAGVSYGVSKNSAKPRRNMKKAGPLRIYHAFTRRLAVRQQLPPKFFAQPPSLRSADALAVFLCGQ